MPAATSKEIAQHAAKEPYGFESTVNMGSMATLNQTWWLEELEKKKEVRRTSFHKQEHASIYAVLFYQEARPHIHNSKACIHLYRLMQGAGICERVPRDVRRRLWLARTRSRRNQILREGQGEEGEGKERAGRVWEWLHGRILYCTLIFKFLA